MAVAAPQPHVGSVGLIGRPSTGKSSLVNRICGHKVAIVSPVPQTTRSRVRGIVTRPQGQLIFLDTPGLHLSERKMNLVLRDVALSVTGEVDLLLLVFDAGRAFGREDHAVLTAARGFSGPCVAVRNKVDLKAPRDAARAMAQAVHAAGIDELHPVSALTGAGVERLVARLLELSPRGDLHYPADVYTDQSPDFRVAEIVRELVFRRTRAEVPHAVYVEVLDLEPRADGLWARATIWVEPGGNRRGTARCRHRRHPPRRGGPAPRHLRSWSERRPEGQGAQEVAPRRQRAAGPARPRLNADKLGWRQRAAGLPAASPGSTAPRPNAACAAARVRGPRHQSCTRSGTTVP